MKREIKVQVGDETYWSDGTPLGDCKRCREETAFHYDEDGNALCTDCLIMSRLELKMKSKKRPKY